MGAMQPKLGKDVETDFKDRWNNLGKAAWLYRLADVAELYGKNNGLVITDAQPADFLAVYDGWNGLIECKGTTDPIGFRLSLIRKSQHQAATRHIAGGVAHSYRFAIRSEVYQKWFLAPASIIQLKGTIRWQDLSPYEWGANLPCLFPTM